jgi:HME family heavy-metal exporter
VPFFPKTFLPPFNEGTLLIGMRLNPGVTLAESSALAQQAEVLVKAVPEVVHVGRRSGRAELDEHAEGVHVSELDVGLKPASEMTRSMDEISADIRARLINLPAAIAIGQPISHRIDHMLSGVRSQIAIKIFGDDLDTLRGQADVLRGRLAVFPVSPIWKSRSRCWRRRSRSASIMRRRRNTACRHRRFWRRCKAWSKARR